MVWQRGPAAHGEKAASMLSHNFDSVGRLCLAGVLCSNTYLTPFVASPTPLCSLAIAHVRECAREGGAFARRECFIFLAHPPTHTLAYDLACWMGSDLSPWSAAVAREAPWWRGVQRVKIQRMSMKLGWEHKIRVETLTRSGCRGVTVA